jgi:hypothetical protein
MNRQGCLLKQDGINRALSAKSFIIAWVISTGANERVARRLSKMSLSITNLPILIFLFSLVLHAFQWLPLEKIMK